MDFMAGGSCFRHDFLPIDAWSEVSNTGPRAAGVDALLVCRFSCPIRQQCRDQFQGVGIVAGGGWWDQKGNPRDDDLDLFDAYQAAGFLGKDVRWVRHHTISGELTVVRRVKQRPFYALDNLRDVASQYAPICGSEVARRLHHLKGEWPCQICTFRNARVLTPTA